MNTFAAFVPFTATPAAPAPKFRAPENGQSKCRCSASCLRTTWNIFAQGHDARMVSLLVAQVVAGQITSRNGVEAIRKTGASDALVDKFLVAVGNAVTRAQAKAERRAARNNKAAAPAPAATTRADVVVRGKVGRWTYDGQVVGSEFRYTDKAGVAKVATKFQLI